MLKSPKDYIQELENKSYNELLLERDKIISSIELIEYYRNNKLHGKTTSYDTMGNLMLEEYFYDGVKEGIERKYSKNGSYLEETIFENNKEQSKTSYQKIRSNKLNSLINKLREVFCF